MKRNLTCHPPVLTLILRCSGSDLLLNPMHVLLIFLPIIRLVYFRKYLHKCHLEICQNSLSEDPGGRTPDSHGEGAVKYALGQKVLTRSLCPRPAAEKLGVPPTLHGLAVSGEVLGERRDTPRQPTNFPREGGILRAQG